MWGGGSISPQTRPSSTEVAKVTLQKQADWLARHSAYKIKVEGFADDGGGAESNKTLGLKRAGAVRAYLGSLGLASARMRTKTFGNLTERLVHNCNDLSCRAQNRGAIDPHPKGRSTAESGGRRLFCRARNGAQRQGKIVAERRCGRRSSAQRDPRL